MMKVVISSTIIDDNTHVDIIKRRFHLDSLSVKSGVAFGFSYISYVPSSLLGADRFAGIGL